MNLRDWYTWAEFKEAVRELMPLDAQRLGLTDTVDGSGNVTKEGFVTRLIRQGVIDLQDFIPAYRVGQETVYEYFDFTTEGLAQIGVLPPQAQVREPYVWVAATETRHPVLPFSWERRFEMVDGQVEIPDNNARMAVDPQGYTFYLYPVLAEGDRFSLFWDGLKLDFADTEQTPLDEGAAGAVAEYVKGKLEREVNRDLRAYDSYFNPKDGSYITARRNLFLAAQDRGRIKR